VGRKDLQPGNEGGENAVADHIDKADDLPGGLINGDDGAVTAAQDSEVLFR
jgi:hypothetical protein